MRHDHFGEGVVVSSTGVGGDTQVTVAFAGQGVKRIMLSFAPLEKVEADGGAGVGRPDGLADPAEAEIEILDPDLFAP